MPRSARAIPARRVVVVLAASLVVSGGSLVTATTTTADAATSCRAYTALGVRGTDDQPAPSGSTLPKAVGRFVAVKGSSRVRVGYVVYPASKVYGSSVRAGRAALLADVASWAKRCPSTKFALFGYSQGAQIVGDVVGQLSPGMRRKVYGVGLIGDPVFNPTLRGGSTKDTKHGGMFGRRTSWPSGVYIRDVCNRGDQVCASITEAQSLGYLTGWFGKPKEHEGYTGTTYSPVAGHSGAWVIGSAVAAH